MTFFDILFNKEGNGAFKSSTFKALRWFVGIAGFFIAGNIWFPQAVSVILNVIWILLLVAVVIFLVLGALVILGLRKEAQKILNVLMEGSLTFVDFIEFLKLVWKKFLDVLREFILFITPVVAYIVTFALYALLMVVYKSFGQKNDITIFTIVLTFVLVAIMGILNRPTGLTPDLTVWFNKVKKAFKEGFIDGFEVVLFIFFLTMDSTNLFFLPDNLNVLLHAEKWGYDFMTRGFVIDSHLKYTVHIIVAAISIEVLRMIMKLVAAAKMHYAKDLLLFQGDSVLPSKVTRVKSAIRKSFDDSKDDVIKFITFNTVLFGVFMLFPRLKLLTLLVASITSIGLDIFIPARLYVVRGNDLISRILTKLFRL